MIAYSTWLDAKYYAEDDNAFSSDFLASDGYSKSQKKKKLMVLLSLYRAKAASDDQQAKLGRTERLTGLSVGSVERCVVVYSTTTECVIILSSVSNSSPFSIVKRDNIAAVTLSTPYITALTCGRGIG